MRYREHKDADLACARAAVAGWRAANPYGSREQLVQDLGHEFPSDYAVVLRGVLFAVDRDRAGQFNGQAGTDR